MWIVVFSVIIGAYVNHVFTWKIKDKINTLDDMSKTIAELSYLLSLSGLLSKENDIKECKVLFVKLLFSQRLIVTNILTKQAKQIFNNIEALYNEIIWNRKAGELKGMVSELLITFKFEEEEKVLYAEIIKARCKASSFLYMLKKLFLNWQALIILLVLVLFACFSLSFAQPILRVIEVL